MSIVVASLVKDAFGLLLRDDAQPDLQPVGIDVRHPRKLKPADLLPRAVGFPRIRHVVDVTLGLGRDAWSLWQLGCTITGLERNALLASMWRAAVPVSTPRFTFIEADARTWLQQHLLDANSCIYLDPMYAVAPDQRTAMTGKEMRMVRAAVGEDPDRDDLLSAARATGLRVVQKGVAHAQADHVFRGESTVYSMWNARS
jgi:hypothetical protein